MILPAALDYQAEVANAINSAKAAGAENKTQTALLKEIVEAASQLHEATAALDEVVAADAGDDSLDQAKYCRDAVIPAMDEVRKWADALELIVDDACWPLPKYREMLFIR